MNKKLVLILGIGGLVIILIGGIYLASYKKTIPNLSNGNQNATETTSSIVGSISDNQKFFSIIEKAPSCDLEKWLVENLKPSIDQVFEDSKFVSAGSCNTVPLSGSKFVTKKLLSSVDDSSDARDFYDSLVGETGLSADNNPMDLSNTTQMSLSGLYGQQKVLVLITFNFDTQEIEVKVSAFKY
jgi:hypothetical protein